MTISAVSAEENETTPGQTQAPADISPERPTPEAEPYEKALGVLCPIAKYKGKTLGDVLMLDQNAIVYISKADGKYPEEAVAAARVICEYAAQQSA